MSDTKEKLLPGTSTTYSDRGEKGFSKIEMLLDATGGLSLSQVCAVTGLEGSTIQNWVKRGWVAHPKGKKYEEVHISRILIINALKECIKLENIALLMSYVNGSVLDINDDIIRESVLYNFLCDALEQIGQANDHSRGGVESVVEVVTRSYKGPRADSRIRIRNALSVMIYACVCTDVKRRTEAMMDQILYDLENPERIEAEVAESGMTLDAALIAEAEKSAEAARTAASAVSSADYNEPTIIPPNEAESSLVARKTVSQALREWDISNVSSVERIIIDHNEDGRGPDGSHESEEKASNRPWYLRRK